MKINRLTLILVCALFAFCFAHEGHTHDHGGGHSHSHSHDHYGEPHPLEEIIELVPGGLITLVGLFIFIVIGLFTLWFLSSSGAAKGNTILLLGLQGSGKTVLFEQLRDGRFLNTVTSLKENEDTFVLNANTGTKHQTQVHVVDIPGSLRLRPKLFDFVPITKGIVFLIDAVEFDNEVRNVAEFLFALWTSKAINKKKIPFLIVCNKMDIFTAHAKSFVKTQLQKEIEKLKATAKSIPDQVQDETEEIVLGVPGEQFTIEQLDNEVSFVEASAKQGEIGGVVAFINSVAK